jgi:hypothetical protein
MAAILYYFGLACLFTHELDAVTHSEWRLLFVLRSMPDHAASQLFVALHVPLFFAVLWLSAHRKATVRNGTRLVLAAFLVIHAVLHLSLASRSQYDFHGILSQALIFSAGACGLAYLVAERLRLRRTASNTEHAA